MPTLRGVGGAPTYHFGKLSKNPHEVERIWTPGEPACPPLFSQASVYSQAEGKR